MAETKNPGDKTISVGAKTLSLKPRADACTVRQSFSHGRTKQGGVGKVVKRRLPGDKPEVEKVVAKPAAAAAPAKPATTAKAVAPAAASTTARPRPAPPAADPRASGVVLRTLTDEERNARASA